MATIQAGTGETFKSTTAEGRLIEAVCFLRLCELNIEKNPTEINSVLGDFSIADSTFTGQFNIPCLQTLTEAGSLAVSAAPYLLNTGFAAGANGTLKSATIEAYLLEIVSYLQVLENTPVKNPEGLNNVSGTFNSDTNIYSGTFAIPVQLVLDAVGKATFQAVEYLLS